MVKVPLSELLRIPKHRNKTIAWVGGTNKKVKHDCNKIHTLKESNKERVNDKETEIVVSQIPQIFLDSSVNQYLGSVEPFLSSILVNGKIFKNCMIDSGA